MKISLALIAASVVVPFLPRPSWSRGGAFFGGGPAGSRIGPPASASSPTSFSSSPTDAPAEATGDKSFVNDGRSDNRGPSAEGPTRRPSPSVQQAKPKRKMPPSTSSWYDLMGHVADTAAYFVGAGLIMVLYFLVALTMFLVDDDPAFLLLHDLFVGAVVGGILAFVLVPKKYLMAFMVHAIGYVYALTCALTYRPEYTKTVASLGGAIVVLFPIVVALVSLEAKPFFIVLAMLGNGMIVLRRYKQCGWRFKVLLAANAYVWLAVSVSLLRETAPIAEFFFDLGASVSTFAFCICGMVRHASIAAGVDRPEVPTWARKWTPDFVAFSLGFRFRDHEEWELHSEEWVLHWSMFGEVFSLNPVIGEIQGPAEVQMNKWAPHMSKFKEVFRLIAEIRQATASAVSGQAPAEVQMNKKYEGTKTNPNLKQDNPTKAAMDAEGENKAPGTPPLRQ